LGVPRSDLLVDAAGAGIAPLVAFSVAWDGAPAPGQAPAFTSDPVLRPKALPNTAYVGTLVGTATDPDGNPLTFARGLGPAWLVVAPNGDLSGTPARDRHQHQYLDRQRRRRHRLGHGQADHRRGRQSALAC